MGFKYLGMKKLIFGLAVAALVVSCKKVSAGGNKGTLKLEEGTEHYFDDHQGAETHSDAHKAVDTAVVPHVTKPDSATVKAQDTAKAAH